MYTEYSILYTIYYKMYDKYVIIERIEDALINKPVIS
jgi:hypothetical protein